jgi:thiol-disulfide isomerase/thioredoxin
MRKFWIAGWFVLACWMAACGGAQQHGKLTRMSAAEGAVALCEHEVPAAVCTRCNPELAQKFKEAGDWCPAHKRPESQCLLCHPDLKFEPLPELPEGADYAEIAAADGGQPVESFASPGKVTLVDFYATWCAGCQNMETALRKLLASDPTVAVRKVSVTDWESPAAAAHLSEIAGLPYLVVVGRSGKVLGAIQGFDEATFAAKLAAIRAVEP